MSGTTKLLSVAAEVGGGLAGAVAGYFLYGWIVSQGFYAPMVPGALLGLGAGLPARAPSQARAAVCAAAAFALGLYTEWAYFPFVADTSLRYFVGHLTELRSITLILTAIGAAIAYYLSKDAGYAWRGARGE